jgi:alkanesulfonate monooxygenase SsuD/methylene tetrahydromethanopterin reductase-like flavin-dependent oxidoreductase (luciferase family)
MAAGHRLAPLYRRANSKENYGVSMASHESDFRPAVSVVATAGKRSAIIELAQQADQQGFAGLACPSLGATMGLVTSLAHTTQRISFWTSIQPIYYCHPVEMANTAGHIHEVSGGRFRLGLGVSHGPVVKRLNVQTGKPLTDMNEYVTAMRAHEKFSGELPPIYLATMRDKMLQMSMQIAQGAIWANASLSYMAKQLTHNNVPTDGSFFTANMIPTVIDEDAKAADAVNRKTMMGYVVLPNYRNYWKQVGYVEEMTAIENALAAGERDKLPSLMSDEWLHDCTIAGSPSFVRQRLAEWADAGVLPIAVMSSTSGGQAKAINELFSTYQ